MHGNFNAHLTDPLDELMEFLHVERDIWREYMYTVSRDRLRGSLQHTDRMTTMLLFCRKLSVA